MTLLTLIRHGETDWNRDRRVQGSTDIVLNDTGRAQARDAASALRAQLELAPAAVPPIIVSSDLLRARETAEIIATELSLPSPRTYPDLRERAYGDAEGVDAAEFTRRWGDWNTAEVPGAEPWPLLRERALRGLASVVRDARRTTAPTAVGPTRPEAPRDAPGPTRPEAPLDAPAASGGAVGTARGEAVGRIIVVAHGGVIRELMRHATAGEFPPLGARLANGSAHAFLYERERLSLLSYAGAAA